jgi:hypothetical protein
MRFLSWCDFGGPHLTALTLLYQNCHDTHTRGIRIVETLARVHGHQNNENNNNNQLALGSHFVVDTLDSTTPYRTMGFDWDFVEGADATIKSQFECGICMQLADLNCVITTECSHCFCHDCLKTWCAKRINKEDIPCPLCQTDLTAKNAKTPSSEEEDFELDDIAKVWWLQGVGILTRSFYNIRVRCPVPGCSWTGTYLDSTAHVVVPFFQSTYPVMHFPQRLAVSGAGVPQVNGVYDITDKWHFEWPSYQMKVQEFPHPFQSGVTVSSCIIRVIEVETEKTRWVLALESKGGGQMYEEYILDRCGLPSPYPSPDGWKCWVPDRTQPPKIFVVL